MNIGELGRTASTLWHACQAPFLAAVAGLAVLLAARVLAWPVLGRVAAAAAVLLGWVVLLWQPGFSWIWRPRGWTERLVLAAACGFLLVLAQPFVRGRLGRWVPTILVILVGWWMAAPLGARQEFWRVWLAVAVVAGLLVRIVGDDVPRAAASGLALWGTLMLLTSPAWASVASVPMAVGVALLLGALAARGVAPTLFPLTASVAAAAAGASLQGGFLLRGGVGALDLAALSPVVAASLQPVMARRLGRPWAAVLAAALLAACSAWLLARALR